MVYNNLPKSKQIYTSSAICLLMDFSRVFVFVLASFEADSYFHFIQMRKEIFSKYNIPHMFLFEKEPPSYYACDSNDYVLDREKFAFDPTITLIPDFHPLMIVKFVLIISTLFSNVAGVYPQPKSRKSRKSSKSTKYM
jgi:hypothetical protein